MAVKHGSVARPLTVRADSMPQYKAYITRLISRECSEKAQWAWDGGRRIHLVVTGGKAPDAKRPPKLSSLRFIHEVAVKQPYLRETEGEKVHATEDHAFFFDVTKILPPPLKHKLEIDTGLIGRGKAK